MAKSTAKGITKGMWKRTMIVAMGLIIGLVGVDVSRLFYLQVIAGKDYQIKAQEQQLKDTSVAAARGTIYDSNMNVIAQSATVWNVYINPKKITDKNREKVLSGLTEIFQYDDEKKAKLQENMEKKSSYVEIEKKVENPLKVEISKFVSENKLGEVIGVTPSTKRYYPSNNFASTVIGFTGTDNQGLSGIEAYYDDVLTGVPGRIVAATDAKSNALPSQYETAIDPQDGNSLVLTIDQTIQHYLEKGIEDTVKDYDAKGAYAVVMDVETGAVLAMTTKPDYNVNNPWLIDYEKTNNQIESILDSEEKKQQRSLAVQDQWRNSVISDVYVPGSVFKLFVASAAIEEKVESVSDTYHCTGSIKVADRTMNCHLRTGHGTETFVQGLENSCNPFFITVGQKLGSHNFYKYFDAFGFTEKTGIDLPGEAKPIFVDEKGLESIVSLSSASFGQTNSVTPIQVCTALSAIANGGTLMQPYVVKEVRDSSENIVSTTKPVKKRQVISSETAATVRSMMESVVVNGTGKNGYVAGYHVGGKTGTSTKLGESAEGEKKKYLASFAAIAPSDNPKIAMIVIIDEPNQDLGGGALAAPICATVIEQALKHMNVEPKYTEAEQAKLEIKTPNVVGKTVAEAKSTMASAEFKCKIVGEGETVVKQSPAANVVIPAGGTVVIYTTEEGEKSTAIVPDFNGMSVSAANAAAAAAGINIKLNGNNLSAADSVAFKQSEAVGAEVDAGTIITVYFKHTTGVSDET